MTDATIIEINGFRLEATDSIYEVIPKYDADAPDGYRQFRSSKILNKVAGKNTHSAPFNEVVGVWDTGLYEDSPMYATLPAKKKQEIAGKVKSLIVEPFEKKFGKNKLDPTDPNNPFWNYEDKSSFKIELYPGRLFNTALPEQRLELFIALANKNLCPKDQESSPYFRKAQFCIEDKNKARTLQQENDFYELEAMGTFYNLLDSPKKLKLVLNYVGIKTSKNAKIDKKLITSQFNRHIEHKEHGYQNKKEFIEVAKMAESPEGYNEIANYEILQELYRKGVVKKEFENFILDEEILGTSLKEAAKKITKEPTLQSKVVDLKK